ncbi:MULTISPECIES: type II 3-dehydroquinate dehydratase [Aerococcus]|uniref:3-dehydroquinate dehydratase n=1 Tax=Aerococcus sanguinicola TaxID=119206 RepID=A0A5N1GMA8_9LACT|nr:MULTISPECIES: type II 3-dehydroquinate dehydratase [Aerococcus]KAA9301922.1 type II 3-dehydroquinate dehydratase [Aerococcus sanguinicola]MDK6368656.1 type II 3-dehydroquinate dehydratase [Aerococcus sp. UMB9870]MDK6679739.1 type II 3-dehydroquinate dehydratase [Aerococcus sp. UMB8608]MDK6685989.1 type II 3-dehydroquinate dehydratase [Aerococcus sp. UMB8623]MDK6940795.1 type II 3-dehydroquinate dehydratase [Aerococcus sp. UMB8487]
MKFLILNGPNLNFLGIREPEIYGHNNLQEIEAELLQNSDQDLTFFQSNHEGALIDRLQAAYHEGIDGIVFNPGAFTHYSYALHDALSSIQIPCVEVHLSAIQQRESFRQTSVIAPACIGQISGFGKASYALGIQALVMHLEDKS